MIARLHNTIQTYAWGSFHAIAELQGRSTPTQEPEAELWMGAHPKAPSVVQLQESGDNPGLDEWLREAPEERLGRETVEAFGSRLPFLFKVLAAERALSIQSHPNLAQAREGFARENKAGIPLDARHRNYRDDNHKPELICALTPFEALRGFRTFSEILALFSALGLPSLQSLVDSFAASPNTEGLKVFYSSLLELDADAQRQVVDETLAHLKEERLEEELSDLILRLQQHYPEDASILSPLLLNVVHLSPGQAMYLPAGELHAYLDGTGIELMANSDNVLRGGLTPKHIDVAELLRVLHFSPTDVEILEPRPLSATEATYSSPAPEFALSVLHVRPETHHECKEHHKISLLLCVEGEVELVTTNSNESLLLRSGETALVDASTKEWTLIGDGRLYRATVPPGSVF